MELLVELISKYGPHMALLGFFVWWSYTREKQLSSRLDTVQDQRMRELVESRDRMVEVVKNNTEAFHMLREAMNLRPCLIPDRKR